MPPEVLAVVSSRRLQDCLVTAFVGGLLFEWVYGVSWSIGLPVAAILFSLFWLIHPMVRQLAVRPQEASIHVEESKDTRKG